MRDRLPTRGLAIGALIAVLAGGISLFDPVTSAAPMARAAGWLDAPATPAASPVSPVVGPDFSAIVERYGPAVVNVAVEGNGSTPGPGEAPQTGQPPVTQPHAFGAPSRPDNQPTFGLGSGFIINPDGVILTSAHVVADSTTVTVRLSDQREFTAKVIGLDRPSDVALLKIDAQNLPTVVIGDPTRLRVGAWVLAIGSPHGFDSTATAGIVSATTRSLPHQAYVPFIQTDVPVNPGNSGGPLFNANGEVIGVNSQIYTDTGGFQGLSFAVPIDVAMKVAKRLESDGVIRRGWLGAGVQDVSQALADAFGLPTPRGALVNNVDKNGPAAEAGLQPGDVVLAIDGVAINRSFDLPPKVADLAPGARSTLDVWRRGETRQLAVVVGALKVEAAAAPAAPARGQGRLGLSVRALSPKEADALDEGGGLLVQSVSGPAARAGMQPGDVVLAINGEPVTTVEKLRTLADKSGHHAALLIRREGAKLFLPLTLG
ncbi:Do family serine endopeptidase [Vineibacter terrae]|uniref:Probable periplasmic serine endoprotease DegP-like n=1 Tax=Vineibacter terrae TaxID=2586908 RepID=A0A5C8PH78_9HYPH|nr:Do family serine endopeptidase [Vineibacter terrae]TXL73030.1 Do family serine endopeptidase [Vineibacter terrae]